MSHQVLARKWRPNSFKNMVGQTHIVRMLENALQLNRIHHAYLFTGTRGVGKTTIARILAKCLNCEVSVSATPCNSCATCQAIDQGQFLDLYEIDAASRTKVEDTRELLDNVLYPPTSGRYKVYLIDEVHMLSNHSFNALLKTLEEPPAHVKFLLATTDPKRLPITILSRCLQFHLQRISTQEIQQHLAMICEAEHIQFEVPGLQLIAEAADGSLRDSLSLLDQAIAYGKDKVQLEDVRTMLGSIAQEEILPLINALAQGDKQKLWQLTTQLTLRIADFYQLFDELIQILHRMAVLQVLNHLSEKEDDLKQLAETISPEDLQLYYQIALLGKRDLPFCVSPAQGFEMTILRMLAFKPAAPETKSIVINANPTPSSPALKIVAEEAVSEQQSIPVAQTSNPTALPDWRTIIPKLGLSGMAYAIIANCSLQAKEAHKITLALDKTHEPMLNAKLKERIIEKLSEYFGEKIELVFVITTTELVTPIKQQREEDSKRLAQAKQTVLQDPHVKKLIDMYDATVEVSLI